MKRIVKIVEMIDHGPAWLKDAVHHVAKDAGLKTDDLELHRLGHSEKAKVNQIDPKERKALKYVSARTQDRDDEIVIPKAINLDEFRKYAHVLVNHNYSLLPVGSDEFIEADDFGIKAMTRYADTGEGTLANVVWALVSQGHMKASSIGFVPTSYTKPGDRNWDHVANGLQQEWKEFDKARAEKSISRIVTGGVLLEHSDVSVPCNTDAELITVVKSLHVDDKMLRQLGWETLLEGIVAPVNKGLGTLSVDDLRGELMKLVGTSGGPNSIADAWVQDIYEDHFIFQKGQDLFSQGYAVNGGNKVSLVGEPEKVSRRTVFISAEDEKSVKGFHDEAVEKPNPHIPGGSFTACVAIMEEKYDTETAKAICGRLKADRGGDFEKSVEVAYHKEALAALEKGESKAAKEDCEELSDKLARKLISLARRVEGSDKETEVENLAAEKDKLDKNLDGADEELADQYNELNRKVNAFLSQLKQVSANKGKGEVKVLRHPKRVKVLFQPSEYDIITTSMEKAVSRALARRTGKIA